MTTEFAHFVYFGQFIIGLTLHALWRITLRQTRVIATRQSNLTCHHRTLCDLDPHAFAIFWLNSQHRAAGYAADVP